MLYFPHLLKSPLFLTSHPLQGEIYWRNIAIQLTSLERAYRDPGCGRQGELVGGGALRGTATQSQASENWGFHTQRNSRALSLFDKRKLYRCTSPIFYSIYGNFLHSVSGRENFRLEDFKAPIFVLQQRKEFSPEPNKKKSTYQCLSYNS